MKKKIVAMCATVAIAAVAVGGTLAYFTAETQVEENVFSVGDVAITLDEPQWDKLSDQDKVITPAKTIAKDPTVTVVANSEECYVRLLVTVENIANFKAAFPGNEASGVFLLENFVDWNSTEWEFVECTEAADGSATYEFGYYQPVAKSKNDTELTPLFTTITIPADATNADLEQLPEVPTINVVAQAVQAQGFSSYADAFDSTFDKQ